MSTPRYEEKTSVKSTNNHYCENIIRKKGLRRCLMDGRNLNEFNQID